MEESNTLTQEVCFIERQEAVHTCFCGQDCPYNVSDEHECFIECQEAVHECFGSDCGEYCPNKINK